MTDLAKYFDCNATTPMTGAAREAWLGAVAENWHNPSSLYREAGEAKRRLEDAREEIADRLGLDEPGRIVFTCGATEANNEAIRFLSAREGALALSAIEHPSVDAPARTWFGEERTREIPVDLGTGAVDLEAASASIRSGEIGAVSVMAANNETGVLQPWREIAAICRESGVPFHCDAAQWIGKMPLDGLGECGFLTGSAHKFGGGKGVGFLAIPEECFDDFHGFVGGPQEEGRRAGTENLPGVLAMTAALEERAGEEIEPRGRDLFEETAAGRVGIRLLGEAGPRLGNTSMFVLPFGKNVKWLTRLSRLGFCVSTGSACSAGRGNPSRVMAAMGLDFEEMGRVIRASGGWDTREEDWLALAEALGEVGEGLR